MTSTNVSAYIWKETEERLCHKFFPQIMSLWTRC